MRALRSINYEGYISLEWLEAVCTGPQRPRNCLPHFANYMRQYMDSPEDIRRLYDNHAKTGKYVWPKEHLIDLTFPQVLDRMVDEFPDQYAFRYTTLDYTDLFGIPRRRRHLCPLANRDGGPAGDHVAIWATNVPQWYITFWATTKIGAVLVTVNTAYKIHEAEYLLSQSDTHTLVMIDGYKDSDYIAIMKELCPELETAKKGHPLHLKRLPFLRNIITCDSEQRAVIPGKKPWRFQKSCQSRKFTAGRSPSISTMSATCSTLPGRPDSRRDVMLTHYNVVNNGKAIGDCMDLSTADRMMIQVPMFHCFGMVLAMTAAHMAPRCRQSPLSRQKKDWTASTAKKSPASTAYQPCLSLCWDMRISTKRISAICAPVLWQEALARQR